MIILVENVLFFSFPFQKVHIENKQTAMGASLCLELGNALRVIITTCIDFPLLFVRIALILMKGCTVLNFRIVIQALYDF